MKKNRKGMTLIELLIVLAIFSVVMAGLYSAYSTMMRQGIKEYRLAESEVELQIARTVLYRDMAMAGYGIADYYCESPTSEGTCISGSKCGTLLDGGFCIPRAVSATNGTSDTLTLMGTALGRETRASQAWSYTTGGNYTTADGYRTWTDDPREAVKTNDWIIYMEPNVKRLLTTSGSTQKNTVTDRYWLFPYPASGTYPNPTLETGVIAYGVQPPSDAAQTAKFPYSIVNYSLGGTRPSVCEPSTQNLLRSESRTSDSATGQPLLNCVMDLQVAFGLDRNEDGTIDCWDNGGVEAAGYNSDTLKTRLKQVRAYVLVQEGAMDPNYTYSNPDPYYSSSNPNKIRVGDLLLTACNGTGVGSEITLSDPQRKYRWRVLAVSIAPRNVR